MGVHDPKVLRLQRVLKNFQESTQIKQELLDNKIAELESTAHDLEESLKKAKEQMLPEAAKTLSLYQLPGHVARHCAINSAFGGAAPQIFSPDAETPPRPAMRQNSAALVSPPSLARFK